MSDDTFEPQMAILPPAAMERVRRYAEEQGVELLSRPAAGCGRTSVGGWHCEGTGCLDAGRVCMHGAAAPVAAADLGQAWAAGVMDAWRPVTERVRAQVLAAVADPALWALPGLTVNREALGLEPSASQLLAEHYDRLRDAMNRQEYVWCAEAYGDAWSPAMAYVHGFSWYPPLNPPRADPGSGADCG